MKILLEILVYSIFTQSSLHQYCNLHGYSYSISGIVRVKFTLLKWKAQVLRWHFNMPNYKPNCQIMKDYSVAKVAMILTNTYLITQSSKTLQEAQKKKKIPLLKSTEVLVANLVSNNKEISYLRQF